MSLRALSIKLYMVVFRKFWRRVNLNKLIKNIKIIPVEKSVSIKEKKVPGCLLCSVFSPSCPYWDRSLGSRMTGKVKASNVSLSVLRTEECFPGMWPRHGWQGKQSYHLKVFVTEKCSLHLVFDPISESVSNRGMINRLAKL